MKEWFRLRSCSGMPTLTSVQMSLSLVRANVRKHTQADNVKPPYVMQKVNTTTLKVTFASTSMAK